MCDGHIQAYPVANVSTHTKSLGRGRVTSSQPRLKARTTKRVFSMAAYQAKATCPFKSDARMTQLKQRTPVSAALVRSTKLGQISGTNC